MLPSLKTQKPTTIDAYFSTFTDASVIAAMNAVRAAIREAAPHAEECIAYGIPTYKKNGKALVHFGGFKTHVGFYATPTGHAEFAADLRHYKQGKGSVQFPLSEPMPLELIKRIVRFRLAEAAAKE